jgi:uncharacterized protein
MEFFIIRYAVVILLSLFLSACSGLMFFPYSSHLQTPTALGLDYKDVELVAQDGTLLHAWFLPVKQAKGTVLFLHGNAQNISTHIHNVQWLPEAGYQVLLLDYRGFGHSEGTAVLSEMFLDIDAAMMWMVDAPETEGQPLFMLGQSIGASLMLHGAVKHAGNPWLCGLVSDAAFTRYRDIAGVVARRSWLTWPLHFPIFWRTNDKYDPIDGVSGLAGLPILFFHSRDDQVIPFSNLDLIVAEHKGSHQRIATSGRHTATFTEAENRKALVEFIDGQTCPRLTSSLNRPD